MKTINIKGKEYVPVVERVKEFHKLYPDGEIFSEVISSEGGRVSVKATVKICNLVIDPIKSKVISAKIKTFTGHSQAEYGKGMMGDVALEIAETSAIGRALGFANIGLIDGIASADEMRKVKSPKSEPAEIKDGETTLVTDSDTW